MATFFKFYYLCLKDAWHGSIERANAAATIIGAIIIWSGLWAWGYQLRPPETFGEGIFVAVLCLVAAWVALFIVRFFSAPPRLYAILEQENARLNKLEDRKNIRIALGGFHQEGQTLRLRCEKEIDTSPPIADANLWAEKAETFMYNRLDESWIIRFRDGSNIQRVTPLPQPPRDHYSLWYWIHIRIVRLGEFMDKLSDD